MAIQTRWEVFRSHDHPIGLLYRRWSETELLTDIIFGKPEPHRITSHIELAGTSWTRSTYREDSDNPVVIEAAGLIEEEDAIPTYMEFLLLSSALGHMESGGEETLRYHVLSPADYHGAAQEASLWSPNAGQWEIETNGDLSSTHWTEGTQIVRSEWNGVSSVLTPPAEAVKQLAGIIAPEILAEYLAAE